MKYCKNFTVSLLTLLLLSSLCGYAQKTPSCDIPVKADIVDSGKGLRNGEINLDFGGAFGQHIRIFIAEPFEKVVWRQAESNKVTGLKAGFYDIMIVDTSRKECAKQLTVEIKSK